MKRLVLGNMAVALMACSISVQAKCPEGQISTGFSCMKIQTEREKEDAKKRADAKKKAATQCKIGVTRHDQGTKEKFNDIDVICGMSYNFGRGNKVHKTPAWIKADGEKVDVRQRSCRDEKGKEHNIGDTIGEYACSQAVVPPSGFYPKETYQMVWIKK